MLSVFSHAVKSWRSAKAIALLATLAFAIGIGATTAIYTVVNTVILGRLPYPDGDRFVAVYSAQFTEPNLRGSLTFPDLVEFQRRTSSFDVFGGFMLGSVNLSSPGEPQHVSVTSVMPSLAHNLGVSPFAGRWFTDETGAVISYALWRRLGGDPGIVGQGITLDGRRLTITGIMPPGFRLPVGGIGTEGFFTDVWLYLDPLGRGKAPARGFYFAYGRRRAGVTLAQAESDVKSAAAEIAKLNPATHPSYTARVDDLRDTTSSTIQPTLLLLFAASALLLLIACANVAGLLLARSVARARETATRIALGASRSQLAVHYFVEGLLLSLAGAAAGVLMSIALVRFVLSIASDYIPRATEIGIDSSVLLFALGTAFLASALSSLAPLWQAFRTAPHEALGSGVRASASARARRLSQSLVVAEIALAFTLLAVSAVLIAHLRTLTRTSPGFEADNLLTFSLTIPESTASSEPARVSFQKRLTDALTAIPGVRSAGFGSGLPLEGCCFGGTIYPEGRTVDRGGAERTSFVFGNPEYMRTMRIPLRSGRLLTEADTAKDLAFVVINQAAATKYWPNQDPINAYGRLNGPGGSRFQIVGVVGDVRNDGLGNPTVPEVYMLNAIFPVNPMSFAVRSELPAATILPEIRRALQRIDPTLPVYDAVTMNDIIGDSVVLERVGSFMTTFFALAALLMATLGVYGMVSYSVRQRRVEIGTRMALGAVGRDLMAVIVGVGLKMAGYGIAIGGVAVVAAVWLLVRLLDVRDIGWLPFVSSTAVVAGVAAAASLFPAWRVTRLSPMAAIRDETPSMWPGARLRVRHAMKEG